MSLTLNLNCLMSFSSAGQKMIDSKKTAVLMMKLQENEAATACVAGSLDFCSLNCSWKQCCGYLMLLSNYLPMRMVSSD